MGSDRRSRFLFCRIFFDEPVTTSSENAQVDDGGERTNSSMRSFWTGTAVVVVALASAANAVAAPPANKPFTIGNYPVEARAKNAVAAKEAAIADGQQAAFRSLLKRLVPVTAYRSLDPLKTIAAADYLDGVSVRSERNSGTEYIASLDFTFQADAVRNLLNGQGVAFVETQAPEIVVIPILRDAKAAAGAAGEFRPASGPWSNVWKDLDLTNALAPARLETLKPVVHADTLRMFYDGSGDPVRILAGEYRAEKIVVAIAEVDTEARRVDVMLAGEDAAGPFAWKKSYKLSDGDLAYTLELAAVVSQGVLEGRWKSVLSNGGVGASAAALEDVQLELQFANPDQWAEVRGRLLEVPGLDDVRVGVVTGSQAAVAVKYPGGGAALATALANQGLTAQNAGAYWSVRPSN